MANRNDKLPPPDGPGSADRYIYFVAPRCKNPACRSKDLRAYHTDESADGSVSRYSKCKHCGWKYIVVET